MPRYVMVGNSLARLLLLIMSVLYPCSAWADLVIHVSPTASPQAALADLHKHPDLPVTLPTAIQILKDPTLRDKSGALKENVQILIASGVYHLTQTLLLDAAYSGSSTHPVTISGPKDASAIISGGSRVTDFIPVTDPTVLSKLPANAQLHVLQADLKKQGITDYGHHTPYGFAHPNAPAALELFYQNNPMTLARWPNDGYAKIVTLPDGKTGRSFTLTRANLNSWQDENRLMASGYWYNYWAYETLPVDAIDPQKGTLTLKVSAPRFGMKIDQPIFIQNVLSELDQPSEWYLDEKNGILYFWPPQPIKEDTVEVSLLNNLLVVNNAHNINISGLTFQSARGDAISVHNGKHITISHSVIRNVGGRGAFITGLDNGLTDMMILDTGKGGVVLSGGDRQTLIPANLYVEKATIKRFSRLAKTYHSAVSLAGVGNRVIDSQISDASHAAIIFTGNDHLISRNEISNVCKETGDAGVIYTGRDWTSRGTVISYNYIHDIPPNAERGGTKGVYLDDQACGTTVCNNLFMRVSEAIFIGGGRDNIIENNTFIESSPAIHLDARGRTWQKQATDDPNGELRKRLANVPYKQSPYKEKYPPLAKILEDETGFPKYNLIRENLVIGGTSIRILDKAEAGMRIEALHEVGKK